MSKYDVFDYKTIATDARKKVLDLIYKAQTSHIGSNFSCADIMAVLFEKIDLDKDIFVLSAGWKAAMLYYFLWRKGRISTEELDSYCQPGSKWIGLSEPIHKDIKFSGGSMQMGLPAAVGFALAKKMNGEEGKVYCLMSDGEMAGGMIWESALIAAHHKLNNLVVIVDNNQYQAMGRVKDVLNVESLAARFGTFKWHPRSVAGHDFEALERAIFADTPYESYKSVPLIVIAKTIKGWPVSFMRSNNLFHYKAPNEDEYNRAMAELA